MKEFDFSQMEDMAQMLGIPSDMIKQMSEGINEQIKSGDIDEKTAKKMEKNLSKSTKMMNKITEKLKKKGIDMPDVSSFTGMGMPDISSLTGMEMPDLNNIDLSNVNGMDMSFIKDMDINNLTPENIAKLQEAAKDIKLPESFDVDDVFENTISENNDDNEFSEK